jgi:transcriptional regulator with XRE-family HTH domain
MTIATRLDEAMKAARIPSQAALARASGVPQPTINRILKGSGKNGPETGTLSKLAAACNVTFEWLQGGIGLPTRNNAGSQQTAAAPKPTAADSSEGYSLSVEKLLLINAIDEREAMILRRYRMANAVGVEMIEAAAANAPRKNLGAVTSDETQNRLPGTSDGHSL